MKQAEFAALIEKLGNSQKPTDIRDRLIIELMFYRKLTKEELASIFQVSPRRIEQIIKKVSDGKTTKDILDNQKQKERLMEACDSIKEGIGEL